MRFVNVDKPSYGGEDNFLLFLFWVLSDYWIRRRESQAPTGDFLPFPPQGTEPCDREAEYLRESLRSGIDGLGGECNCICRVSYYISGFCSRES